MDVNLKIDGLRELDAKLAQLSAKGVKRAVTDGLKAGGRVFQRAVTQGAQQHIRPPLPSGTALYPGALAQDIELHIGRDDGGLPAAIVSPGKYTRRAARWVEYGHRQVRGGYSHVDRHTGRVRGPGVVFEQEVPAHPFIRPAYEATRAEAATVAAQTMMKRVTELSKKAGTQAGG